MKKFFLLLFLFFVTFTSSLFSMRVDNWGKYDPEKKAFVGKDENGFEFERSIYQRILYACVNSETDSFFSTCFLTYDENRDVFIEQGKIGSVDSKFMDFVYQRNFIFVPEISAIIVGQDDFALAAYAICKNIKRRAQKEPELREQCDVGERYFIDKGKKMCMFEYLWHVYKNTFIDVGVRIYEHEKHTYKHLGSLVCLDDKAMNTVLLNVLTKNYIYVGRHGKKNRKMLTLNPKRCFTK